MEPQCRGGGTGHQSLVVAVVRVPHDGKYVANSEDHRGNPRQPEEDIDLKTKTLLIIVVTNQLTLCVSM